MGLDRANAGASIAPVSDPLEPIVFPALRRVQGAMPHSNEALGSSPPFADASIALRESWANEVPMRKKRRYLTATMPDGYVKTIGPRSDRFTHYWRIVAELENGKSEVFWGHTSSLAEARRKRAPTEEAARM